MKFLDDLKYKLKSDTITNLVNDKEYQNIIDKYHFDDNFKVLHHHPVTDIELLNLCGGIPSREICEVKMSVESISPHVLFIKSSTNLYEVKRRVDFENLEIFNDLLVMKKNSNRKKSIGTFALINQIKQGKKLGFKRFNVIAKGGRHLFPPNRWNGHYTWGRLGFEMKSIALEEFQEWLTENNRVETTLRELLSTDGGRNLWKTQGSTWVGEFHLDENSSCIQNLQTYLKEKGIRARL